MADPAVSKIMNRRVITLKPNQTMIEAMHIFVGRNISGAPVVKGKKLVGILSDSDVSAFLKKQIPELRKFPKPYDLAHALTLFEGKQAKEQARLKKKKVSSLMTRKVISVQKTESMAVACELMVKKGINRLPVLDGKKLVGIVTRTDVLRSIAGT
jgi:CBS domain-containing protein